MSIRSACRFSVNIGFSKRLNSTLIIEDEELIKRKSEFEQNFTAGPFDNGRSFSVPENNYTNEALKLNDPSILPSPFVSFNATNAFKSVLKKFKTETTIPKYHEFLRLKFDGINEFQDQLDLMVFWEQKFKRKLKPINQIPRDVNLKFTEDLKQLFSGTVNTEQPFQFSAALDQLSEKLPQFPFENLVSLYIKITPFLTEAQRGVFLEQMERFFDEHVLHFHDQTLEEICLDLLTFNHTRSVTSIILSYDSNSNSEFLSNASISFCQAYLESLIAQKDVKVAHHCLEFIVEQGYMPLPKIVAEYVELVNQTANAVDAEKKKKEMLFNLLTKPLFVVLTQPGMLNAGVVSSLSDFVRLHNIEPFIKYLKQSPDYKNITEIPEIILGRIESSTTFLKKSDQSKAVYLTGTLKQFEWNADDLPETTKLKIIKLYTQCHSPLAVLLWSKTLSTPLSVADKTSILEQLSGESNNVSHDIDISAKL